MPLTTAAPEAAANNNFLLPNGTFFVELVIFLVFFWLLNRLVVRPIQKVLMAGVFVLVGLALGAANTWGVQRSVVRFGESESADKKKKFVLGSVGRLALVTLVAAIVLWLARLDGIGILAGLALFQLIMLGGAAVPLIKELRNS